MRNNIKCEEYADNVLGALVNYFEFMKNGEHECEEVFNLAHAKFAQSIFPSSFKEEDIVRFSKNGFGLTLYSNDRFIVLDSDNIGGMAGFLFCFYASNLIFDEQAFKEFILDINNCRELQKGKLSKEKIYNVVMGIARKYGKKKNKKGEGV
ncbi:MULTISPECIES: hypothetical protein [Pseudomonas]|uniref:Uncharacterized protein n=1 Tax=Pseudomonas moraviensis R28-S TaxID=1395516 RepID=V8R403_9PSED|nr:MULTISPECIES: hypothetical protein [Pseudomonas]ETF06851.1 hypothetical protein PMO01_18555 [Pseudomonas moraviensis R28-S]WCI65294.1 hypothetical protein PMJ94_11385 [Pseudomonas aeruginosa]